MKRLLIILFLFIFLKTEATTVYVSPTGNDATGNGTSGNPYASLHQAASVAVSGDLIQLAPGTYNEGSNISYVDIGVNINGSGQGITIVNLALSGGDYPVRLVSASNTDGNQYIKNITFTGTSLTSNHGILIETRNNVLVQNCTFRDFLGNALYYEGQPSGHYGEEYYATGNEISFDSVINCSDKAYGGGMVMLGGQDGMSMHDCYLDQTARASTHNGDIVGMVEGYIKNLKFFNNTSLKPDDDGAEYNFHLEVFNSTGGNEVYNNNFTGGEILDIAQNISIPGASSYGWSFHDNYVKLRTIAPTNPWTDSYGVNVETYGGSLLVYNNKFENMVSAIQIQARRTGGTYSGVKIYNNLFLNCGIADGSLTENILLLGTSSDIIRDVSIDNNTFYNSNTSVMAAAVIVNAESSGQMTNVNFRNNIVQGCSSAFFRIGNYSGGLVDTINVDTNIPYNNANSNNVIYEGSTPTHMTVTNSIKSNPLLDANYLPGSGSPALGAAINVGLPTTNIGYYGTGATPIVPLQVTNTFIRYGNYIYK